MDAVLAVLAAANVAAPTASVPTGQPEHSKSENLSCSSSCCLVAMLVWVFTPLFSIEQYLWFGFHNPSSTSQYNTAVRNQHVLNGVCERIRQRPERAIPPCIRHYIAVATTTGILSQRRRLTYTGRPTISYRAQCTFFSIVNDDVATPNVAETTSISPMDAQQSEKARGNLDSEADLSSLRWADESIIVFCIRTL
jgi:hypothetical protein